MTFRFATARFFTTALVAMAGMAQIPLAHAQSTTPVARPTGYGDSPAPTAAPTTSSLPPAATGPASGVRTGAPRGGFNAMDTNHDGVISLDEWTADGRPAPRFAKIDTNHDGKVTREELMTFRAAMRARLNGQGGGQAAPGETPGE